MFAQWSGAWLELLVGTAEEVGLICNQEHNLKIFITKFPSLIWIEFVNTLTVDL